MGITWVQDGEELHAAEAVLDGGSTVHLAVEELCGIGWDWQVWNAAHAARLHYGLADSLDQAKTRAEQALATLTRQLVA